MPLHLTPQTRRHFLKTTLAGGTAMLASRSVDAADSEPKSNRWALLADTHIAGNPSEIARGVTMNDNLNHILDEVLAEQADLSGVIINGDCAYLQGLAADYATLSKTLQRLVDADLPVHMTMGNHDDRVPFYDAFNEQRPDKPLVEGKHVSMLASPAANLFLVDSLWKVDHVTGKLGGQQLDWLTKALDANRQKPAIVIGHHNLQFPPEGSSEQVTGLSDSQVLLDTLHDRPHVQAYIFGHTHNWNIRQTARNLHLINQPPCAYLFDASRPNGWVRAELGPDRLRLELRALDRAHPEHGQTHDLKYRS